MKPDIDLEEEVKEQYPSLYAKAYPRRYQHPDSFHSPKCLVLAVASTYMESKLDFKMDGVHTNEPGVTNYHTLVNLTENGVPTYFVAKDLLLALMNTTLPPLRLCDLKWTLPSMLLIMPKGVLQSPDGEVQCIAIARGVRGHIVQPLLDEHRCIAKDAITTVCLTDHGCSYSWAHPLNDDPVDIGASDPVMSYFCPQPVENLAEGSEITLDMLFKPIELPEADKQFLGFASQLAIQILLAMAARPDLIEAGARLRPGRPAKKDFKAKPEIWAPNYIGKRYKVKIISEPGSGTHSSPKTHWRRGHFRLYEPSAENRWKMSKQVWIEPCIVNPPK